MYGRYESPLYKFKLNLWGFRIRRRRGRYVIYDICSGQFRASEVFKSLIVQAMIWRSYLICVLHWKYRLRKVNHRSTRTERNPAWRFWPFTRCSSFLPKKADAQTTVVLFLKSSQERWAQSVHLWRAPVLKIYAVMLWERIWAFVGAAAHGSLRRRTRWRWHFTDWQLFISPCLTEIRANYQLRQYMDEVSQWNSIHWWARRPIKQIRTLEQHLTPGSLSHSCLRMRSNNHF